MGAKHCEIGILGELAWEREIDRVGKGWKGERECVCMIRKIAPLWVRKRERECVIYVIEGGCMCLPSERDGTLKWERNVVL